MGPAASILGHVILIAAAGDTVATLTAAARCPSCSYRGLRPRVDGEARKTSTSQLHNRRGRPDPLIVFARILLHLKRWGHLVCAAQDGHRPWPPDHRRWNNALWMDVGARWRISAWFEATQDCAKMFLNSSSSYFSRFHLVRSRPATFFFQLKLGRGPPPPP